MTVGLLAEPDGAEVVATAADAEGLERPPLLVLDAVRAFLDSRGLGAGPISWQRIGDGQSNITYLLRRGEDRMVLRRGPRPPLPRSTHDMLREARIQQLLRPTGVPLPRIYAVCDDESVLGVPFYVMEALDGTVITDEIPDALNPLEQRSATGEALVDTLVQLHAVDVQQGEIAALGRPDGYLRRQVERFGTLWDLNTTRSLPQVAEIGAWLGRNIPQSQAAAVVHGDYRLGNVMLHVDVPARVQAVLDWEMAALGDPLADVGYLTATYTDGDGELTPLDLSPITRLPGYPRASQLAERYATATGLDLSPLPWYETLALWKAAIFCEAMYTRWLRGERPGDDFAPRLEHGVPLLLERARTRSEAWPVRGEAAAR
jgi:aminoglycoside phosphotransferase (APT) family kinase protein